MDIRRSINTKIWEDTWFEELGVDEKLLWLYLLTNQSTNMVGIYEKSEKKIAFESGLELVRVRECFESFERVNKAKYIDGFVILFNWIKNQSYNTNMKISAVNQYLSLPENIRNECDCLVLPILSEINLTLPKPLKGFETLPKKEREKENEYEEEKEGEREKESAIFTVEDSFKLFDQSGLKGRFFSKMNVVYSLNEKVILEEHSKWMALNESINFESEKHLQNSFNNWLRNYKPEKSKNGKSFKQKSELNWDEL